VGWVDLKDPESPAGDEGQRRYWDRGRLARRERVARANPLDDMTKRKRAGRTLGERDARGPSNGDARNAESTNLL